MLTGAEKLHQDLEFVELLAEQIDAYLMSDTIFWKTVETNLPDLTLGGYLMRQHRLLALRDLLAETEQSRLDTAVIQFNQALVEKGPFFERKASRELEARLRQWHEYLKELDEENADSAAYYSSAVETRVMIAALIDKLQATADQLEAHLPEKLNVLDKKLRQHWQSGRFIWAQEWQRAYPQTPYWWLYGRPVQL